MDNKLSHGKLQESIGDLVVARKRRDRLTQQGPRGPSPSATLAQLLDAPDLPVKVQRLPTRDFSALVQHIGVRDAGEIVALATHARVQAALDDDIFVNAQPGAPEIVDGGRFALWLEVLLEGGDAAAANRVSQLSEGYLALALSKIILVIDDAWRFWPKSKRADEVISDDELASAATTELNGYHLIEKLDVGWDPVYRVLVALDQDHHAFLQRVLARCSALVHESIEDEDALLELSGHDESMAEDVRAEREERRDAAGYVDSRSAVAFLRLSRMPMGDDLEAESRDIISLAHLERRDPDEARPAEGASAAQPAAGPAPSPATEEQAVGQDDEVARVAEVVQQGAAIQLERSIPFMDAVEALADSMPSAYAARLEELAYLANVVLAGAAPAKRKRFAHNHAAEAALATVALGAELLALRARGHRGPARATADELEAVLQRWPGDLLFRRAGAELAAHGKRLTPDGMLHHRDELATALSELGYSGGTRSGQRSSGQGGI